jgi:hypothetical protein
MELPGRIGKMTTPTHWPLSEVSTLNATASVGTSMKLAANDRRNPATRGSMPSNLWRRTPNSHANAITSGSFRSRCRPPCSLRLTA